MDWLGFIISERGIKLLNEKLPGISEKKQNPKILKN